MTTGDIVASAASVGVLAQINIPGIGEAQEILRLGTSGILVFAVWMLWKKVERQDKEDKEERAAQIKAENEYRQKRIEAEERREKMLLDFMREMRTGSRTPNDQN